MGRKGTSQKRLTPSLPICSPLLLGKGEFWAAPAYSDSPCQGQASVGVVRWLPTPPGSELHHSQLCSARRHFIPRGHKPSQAASDMCRKPSFPPLCQHGLAAMAAFSSWSTQLLNANTPFRLVNNYLAGLCYDYMA